MQKVLTLRGQSAVSGKTSIGSDHSSNLAYFRRTLPERIKIETQRVVRIEQAQKLGIPWRILDIQLAELESVGFKCFMMAKKSASPLSK